MFGLILLILSTAQSASFKERCVNAQDGWFDVSNFLLECPYGVLPVPVIITEPTVGEGIGLAVAFSMTPIDEKGRAIPRSISAAVVAGTNNGSKLCDGGYIGHYRRDNIRSEGFAGKGDINLKFYGFGIGPDISSGLEFNIKALFISQQLAFRLRTTDWFAGRSFDFTDVDTSFD